MNNNKITFAEQFKSWRLSNNFNQTEAARHLGVSPEVVHYWEKGIVQPTDSKILTICEELDFDPHLFLKKKTNPFAEELKKRRSELGMTQTDISWELGKIPSRIALEDICSYFGMEVEVWGKLLRRNSRS